MWILSFNSAWIHSFQTGITVEHSQCETENKTCGAIYLSHWFDWNKGKGKKSVQLSKWSCRNGNRNQHEWEKMESNFMRSHIFSFYESNEHKTKIFTTILVWRSDFLEFFNVCEVFFSALVLVYCCFNSSVLVFYGIRFYFIHFTFDQRPSTHTHTHTLDAL